MTDDIDQDEVNRLQDRLGNARDQIRRRLVGQEAVLDQVLACLLADGNALLESTPGLGKTLLVRTIAEVTDCSFNRVQNTPDLMPSDITGTEIIRDTRDGREFTFQPGPIFANVVLADEMNRATPKTQAALLEAMQERQVTAGGETRQLPDPFFVLATQNPVEQEGVYPLPEAQKDRFMAKVLVDYPDRDAEREIVDRYTGQVDDNISVEKALSTEDLLLAQELVRQIPIAEDLRDRVVDLVRSTRESDLLDYGASPRASMGLVVLAKARAFMIGRTHVASEDVEAMAKPVLRHRVVVDFRAERDGVTPDDAIDQLV